MGGAAAAAMAGSEAMFWNPAGLARLESDSPSDLSLAYSNLLETTYAGALAYARPVRSLGVLGAGLVYFSQAPLSTYNELGDATGHIQPNDLALFLSYGRKLRRILLGGNLKMIRSALAETSGTTAALDFGVQAPHVTVAGDGPIDVGASVSNLGPPIKVGSVASPLPLHARVGAFWQISPIVGAALDVNFPVDQAPFVSLGIENAYKRDRWKGFLRLGYNQGRSKGVEGLTGVTAGAGLDLQRLRVDYAWVPFGDLGATNRVSLAFRF